MRSVWAGPRLCLPNLPEEDPADCLSGLSSVALLSLWWASVGVFHCLLPSISQCLLSNLSEELLWCLPWSPTIFLPVSVCWVMRSIWAGPRLCLPISSWRGSCWLSVWTELCGVTVSLVSSVGVFHCLLLICLSSCLCRCLSEFNWCLLRFFWRLFSVRLLLCQALSRRDLLVSVWNEFACLQYLSGELTKFCWKCLPLFVFQCLLVGYLVSYWEG